MKEPLTGKEITGTVVYRSLCDHFSEVAGDREAWVVRLSAWSSDLLHHDMPDFFFVEQGSEYMHVWDRYDPGRLRVARVVVEPELPWLERYVRDDGFAGTRITYGTAMACDEPAKTSGNY